MYYCDIRSCYVTEVRQEAVQQALAAMQGRPKPSLPMPSKRTSVMAKSPDRDRHDSGELSVFFLINSLHLNWLKLSQVCCQI